MNWKKNVLVILLVVIYSQKAAAVEYPIIFLGGNVGYGQNDLKSGLAIKGFFRYSLEAYIPGLQVEGSYATTLFSALRDTTIKLNKEEENIYMSKIGEHQIALSGLLHLRPFGKGVTLFVGGGGNLNFLHADSAWTEKYWDPVASDFQTLDHKPVTLLQELVPGFHVLGGLRFALGSIGFLDFEVRKSFLKVDESAWKFEKDRARYGAKKWDSLSFNAGLTINIF